MNPPIELHPLVSIKPRWQSVVLMCKDCRRRSSGPKKKQAKATEEQLRGVARQSEPRARFAQTSCLGLCPKRAVAVAWLTRDDTARVVAIESADQVAALAQSRDSVVLTQLR